MNQDELLEMMRKKIDRIYDERDYNSEQTLEEMKFFFMGAKHIINEEERVKERFESSVSICSNWGTRGIPLEINMKRNEKNRLNTLNEIIHRK
jgi:hypothetical protein